MFNTAKKLDKLIKFLGLEVWNNYVEIDPDKTKNKYIIFKRDLDILRADFANHLQNVVDDINEDRKNYSQMADHIKMLKDYLSVEMVPYVNTKTVTNGCGEVSRKDTVEYKYVKKTAKF